MHKVVIILAVVSFAIVGAQNNYRVPQRPSHRQTHQRAYESPRQNTYSSNSHSPLNNYVEEPARPYKFNYGVYDKYHGTNFGHSEASNGKEVTGSYTVALPDGRIQKVTYTADHNNGFIAKVTYEGEAKFPETKPKQHQQGPSYKQQRPSYQRRF